MTGRAPAVTSEAMIPRIDLRGYERAEDAVRLLHAVLENMQLGVTITDVDGRIVYCNPADAAIHGYSVAELLGQDVGLFSPPGQRRKLSRSELRAVSSWRRESLNIRRDGHTFSVQLLSDVVRDAAGEPVGVVTTCEDITQRKCIEEDLRASRAELDQRVLERTQDLSLAVTQLVDEIAQRERAEKERQALEMQLRQVQKLEAVGQLTAGIAHDFNNLLAVVLGNAEFLSEVLSSHPDDVRGALGDIAHAAKSGATMIQRLLGFSRQAELRLVTTNLGEVVAGLSDMLRRVIPENIEMEYVADPTTPATRADRGAVQQMLMNLVTNARDAMPRGGRLTVELGPALIDPAFCEGFPDADPGRYARLSVADTGVGMDESARQRVFEPFFTTKAPGKGTGLGMAMVYGLIRQHRGFATIDSEPGRGTTVCLYFPAVRTSLEAAAAPADSGPPPGGTETILLVEDELAIRSTAGRILRRLGYDVLLAADGVQAMTLFQQHQDRVALIVSDLVMPKMGGRGLFDALRARGATTPFLFASGYSSKDSEERTSLPSGVPFIKKPWSIRDLALEIRAALDGRARAS